MSTISRSPNSGSGTPSAPSRVSAGIPRAPLRNVPRRPTAPPPDPADVNTLNMLGADPLNSPDGSLDDASTGGAGFLMGSLAMVAKGIQGLSTGAPGFVPPEILMWLDNALQSLPQLLQQQQSGFGPSASAGTAPPPPPGSAMGAPGMGGSAVGGMGGPM